MIWEDLAALDRLILEGLNGSDSVLVDRLAMLLTSGLTWIPLYLALLYLVIKNNETMAQILLVVCCAGLCLLLAGGIDGGIVKPLVARPRPALDPVMKYSVRIVDGYRASGFSFFSAHTANTMSLAVFFSLLVRDRLFIAVMMLWSLVNCWTRLYLGVHYPSDILCGLLWGVLSGVASYVVFTHVYFRLTPKINYISSQYTRTGYSMADIDVVMMVVVGTLAAVQLAALATLPY